MIVEIDTVTAYTLFLLGFQSIVCELPISSKYALTN